MKQLTTLGLLAILALGAAGIGFIAGQGSTEEVRVVARSANDGRIEFGIEHDGERILPTGRYMSAAQIGARNDKWLRSTPVAIEVGTTTSPTPSTDNTPSSRGASVSGVGPTTQRFSLAAGLYTCEISVSGNSDQYGDSNFAARLYDSTGDYETLANEIASQWSGSSVVQVGGDSWRALMPGSMILDIVYAEVGAQWSLTCN